MNFTSMKELLTSLRSFMIENPTAFLTVKDYPRNLKIGFEAVTDNEPVQQWTLGISKLKNNDGALSEEEYKIVQAHFSAQVAADVAEKDYINLIAGTKVR